MKTENHAKELTDKVEAFCREYIEDFNGKQAAIRCGYSKKTAEQQASRLLSFDKVQKRLKELLKPAYEKHGITAERIVKELERIAFSDLRNILKWDIDGIKLKPSEDLDDDHAAAVSEIKQTTTLGGGSMSVKVHDKLSAIDKLAKYIKLYGEDGGDEKEPVTIVFTKEYIDNRVRDAD